MGVALLLAGCSQSCTLTIYHFHTVVYLAWTCSSNHLLTLIVSRSYFGSRRTMLQWRVVGMTVLFVLPCVAICLADSSAWPASGACRPEGPQDSARRQLYFDSPVSCSWLSGNLDTMTPATYLALALVWLGFLSWLSKLYEKPSRFSDNGSEKHQARSGGIFSITPAADTTKPTQVGLPRLGASPYD